MAKHGSEPTDTSLEMMKRKRVVSAVKVARVAKAVPVAKADKAVRADQLAAKEAVLRVAVVHKPFSASLTSSLISILTSESLETNLRIMKAALLTT